jgi:polyhydroxyalkanoate synthesis repressor PhaR
LEATSSGRARARQACKSADAAGVAKILIPVAAQKPYRAGHALRGAITGASRQGVELAEKKEPTVIKKYANRRLYHTGTSTYVTLEDLAVMVKQGEDFLVTDAKSGEDITRSVLTQIIFEQEGKEGQSLLPITFLRQLIRYYGDSMQSLVPSYLEFSLERFTGDQQKMREMMAKTFGPAAFEAMGEQVRTNMTMFQKALGVFTPFKYPQASESQPAAGKDDVDALKKELDQLRSRLDRISKS